MAKFRDGEAENSIHHSQSQNENAKGQNYIDWGLAPDVSTFYGRLAELATLNQWVKVDRCRFIILLGSAGVGKSFLALKLAEQLQNEFDFIIWRSLHHLPPFNSFLDKLIHFLLSRSEELNLSDTLEDKITCFIDCLKSSRCLLIFDNAEAVCQRSSLELDNDSDGNKKKHLDYVCYREFIEKVGDTYHNSCLLLTSREMPQRISHLVGTDLPIRTLLVKGLEVEQLQKFLQHYGQIQGDISVWNQLTEYYVGNPLMLKIAARIIQLFFDGDIAEFLKYRPNAFSDIGNLLRQQVDRLSDMEIETLCILAEQTSSISFADLRSLTNSSISSRSLVETLDKLYTASILECTAGRFYMAPVLTDYIKEQFL